MKENKERKGNGVLDIQCPISTESRKTDSEESQVRRHTCSLQQTTSHLQEHLTDRRPAMAVDGFVANAATVT